ncbi:MAG: CinA family protein [Dehalococcoidia bacterium]
MTEAAAPDPSTALAVRVVEGLAARGLTLATAEASVGGMIGHLITNVPGASRVFTGGIAPYARGPKVGLLGLSDDMLTAEGSVSEAAALGLARGVRAVMRADLAIAETGVASPTGNPLRPAGMYFVALVAADRERVLPCWFEGGREDIKRQASEAALRLVLDYLDETR